ncbi:hypothetical protein JCM11641_003929 [Rhodosporidiobolus odoratus]
MVLDSAKHVLLHAFPLIPSSSRDFAAVSSRFLVVSHHELPEGIQFLPSLFRVMAVCMFAPVMALTLIDVVGWFFFKLLLRPLGYASTVRFKDPEPPSLLVPAPGAVDHSSPSPVDGGNMIPSSTSSSASDTSSAPSSPSSSIRLVLHDEVDSYSHFPASQTATDSALVSSSSARSHSHNAFTSSVRSTASHSSTSSGDTFTTRMSRDRAASVGLEGPLFEGETTTPVESEAESEGYMDAGKTIKRRRGEGVPKGGFKLGLTEVRRRDAPTPKEEQ